MDKSKAILFFAKIIAVSFAVGALTAVINASGWVGFPRLLVSGLSGAMIGTGCLWFEYAVMSNRRVRWLRRVPIIAVVLMRAAVYSIVIAVSLILPPLLILGTAFWQDTDFLLSFWVSAAIAFAISTGLELLQLLGKEAALAIFTGRYRRPRLENRIVMFADLVGSTALAEAVGDLRFHELLGDIAYDLDEPIAATGGEIHRYVGDAIIATWPMERSENFVRCLICASAMIDVLARRSGTYTARYGQAMQIRIALHCGPLAAGEVGAWKKDIALLGDTMNSAARIEGAARHFDVNLVLSDAFKRNLPADIQSDLAPLPQYAAHGKEAALTLWSLT